MVIENDQILINEVTAALRDEGYEVAVVGDALNGLKSTYELCPDLVVMNRDLPVTNAEEPCDRLKQVIYRPIVVIGEQSDGSEILELGADAYMQRPIDIDELVAKINSLLRRSGRDDLSRDKRGTLQRGSPKQKDSFSKKLTPTEFRLASCLKLNKGRLLDHMRLIREVWGGKKVTLDTLHLYMRRLKQKLFSSNLSMIRGVGYYLSDQSS